MTVRSSSTNSGTGTSIVGNLPAGTANGDLLLCVISIRVRSVTWTLPAGWTEIFHYSSGSGPASSIAAFWLAAGGSEPSTYTFTSTGSAAWNCVVVANTGINTSSPIDATAQTYVSTTTTPATPSVTPTMNGDVLFCVYGSDASSTFTGVGTGQTQIQAMPYLLVSDSEVLSGTGATGGRSATGSSLKYATAAIALASSAVGATTNPTPASQGTVTAPTPVVTGVVTTATAAAPVGRLGAIRAPAPVVVGLSPNGAVSAVVAGASVVALGPAVQGAGPPPIYVFVPPTTKLHYGDWRTQPLMSRVGIPTGATVLKTAGFYTINWGSPSQADINAADVTYLGGHEYIISATEAAALTAAGYGANITTR